MWKLKPHQKSFPSTEEQIQSKINTASQSPISFSVKSLPALVGIFLLVLVITLSIFPPPFDWAGMRESENKSQVTQEEVGGKITKTTTTSRIEPTKTFWDWMSLLLAPATLAGLGFLFQSSLEKAKEAKERTDKEREADQQREQALQSYLNEISVLLIDKKLKKILSEGKQDQLTMTQAIDPDAALGVVKARTLALLRLFDNDMPRKSSVLSFLGDTHLLAVLDLDLSSSNWKEANLRSANLSGANLRFADLSRADLIVANLSGSFLTGAILTNADLIVADLTNANLTNANLAEANLTGADLINVNFTGANLTGTNLSNAILLATDLRTNSLAQQQLEGKDSPLLCNVALSKEIGVDPNRDCDRLPEVLNSRYPESFKTLKDAKDFVDRVRQQKKWD